MSTAMVSGARFGHRQAVAVLLIIVLAPVGIAGNGRLGPIRKMPHSGLFVGTEYRIQANPDSPWQESIAVAAGASSGIVLWTENGPRSQESTVRFARLGLNGQPVDTIGRPLLENGHFQRHVAVDVFNGQFVVAWCDVGASTKQIVALRLDSEGRSIDAAPLVVADNLGSGEPEVGVTCSRFDCLVTWGGGLSDGAFAIGSVNGSRVFTNGARIASPPMRLIEKGLGNGIGSNQSNYCLVYGEPLIYGQSGALVTRFLAQDGTATERPLFSPPGYEVGTTWVAWDGFEWLVLILDLTSGGGLGQEIRFLRMDGTGHPIGEPAGILLESASVPLLCPRVPDLFLYDPQARRVVWDGTNFLLFTQQSITLVTETGLVGVRLGASDYFPRSYATSVSSSGGGRTLVAYSRDNAVAVRLIQDLP